MAIGTKILVLGQNPSAKNKNAKLAFLGTQSGSKLCDWLFHAGVHRFVLANLADHVTKNNAPLKQSEIVKIAKSREFKTKLAHYSHVIAVGRQAEKAVRLASSDVKFVYIPHPSGLNRVLNEPGSNDRIIETIKVFVDNGIKV